MHTLCAWFCFILIWSWQVLPISFRVVPPVLGTITQLPPCLCNNTVGYGEWSSRIFLRLLFMLQWRHNERDGVSNHQPHDCLLKHLFRRRSKKTSKLRVTGLCKGNSPVTGEFPAQRASNAENIAIWRRHHEPKQHNVQKYPVHVFWDVLLRTTWRFSRAVHPARVLSHASSEITFYSPLWGGNWTLRSILSSFILASRDIYTPETDVISQPAL